MFAVKTNHGTYTADTATARAAKVQVLNEWADVYRDLRILSVSSAAAEQAAAETQQDRAARFDQN